mgnify:CR=1 FL=1
MKGYNTSNGYMGYVEGKYILFASEQEYFEFMHYRGYIYVILELVSFYLLPEKHWNLPSLYTVWYVLSLHI